MAQVDCWVAVCANVLVCVLGTLVRVSNEGHVQLQEGREGGEFVHGGTWVLRQMCSAHVTPVTLKFLSFNSHRATSLALSTADAVFKALSDPPSNPSRPATPASVYEWRRWSTMLNTTLVLTRLLSLTLVTSLEAGLFSAIGSAFVIDVHSQPDLNEQSTALLRTILLTLSQSATLDESPIVPPTQQPPLGETITKGTRNILACVFSVFESHCSHQWILLNLTHLVWYPCQSRSRKDVPHHRSPIPHFPPKSPSPKSRRPPLCRDSR